MKLYSELIIKLNRLRNKIIDKAKQEIKERENLEKIERFKRE